jgi:hypothetical protein
MSIHIGMHRRAGRGAHKSALRTRIPLFRDLGWGGVLFVVFVVFGVPLYAFFFDITLMFVFVLCAFAQPRLLISRSLGRRCVTRKNTNTPSLCAGCGFSPESHLMIVGSSHPPMIPPKVFML